MQIVDKKLTDLKPYANNPRHNAKAVPAVKESILKFGFKVPIVIDKNNIIVCGHTRFYASKEIGLETVPCIIADDLTDEQINAFRLVDNRTSEFADWNFDKLAEELSDLQDFDFEPFAFDDLMAGLELDYNLNQKDEETIEDDYDAEPPVETNIKYGDVYQLGSHRLMCGDSTKEEDVEKLMNGEKADMIFTDPPYGVSYTGGVIHGTKINIDHKRTMLKNDDIDIYRKFIPIINSVIEDGAIYIFYATRNSYELLKPLHDNNIELNNIIVWNKINTGYADMNSHYKNKYKPCVYCKRKGHKLNFVGDNSENTVWEIKKDKNNKLHPTQKPIELVARAIKNSSLNENIILDLFGGSGSTLIACEQLNRKCYMMELDEHYVQVIIDRYEKFTGKKAEKIE